MYSDFGPHFTLEEKNNEEDIMVRYRIAHGAFLYGR
jgi:hypothetical protein